MQSKAIFTHRVLVLILDSFQVSNTAFAIISVHGLVSSHPHSWSGLGENIVFRGVPIQTSQMETTIQMSS